MLRYLILVIKFIWYAGIRILSAPWLIDTCTTWPFQFYSVTKTWVKSKTPLQVLNVDIQIANSITKAWITAALFSMTRKPMMQIKWWALKLPNWHSPGPSGLVIESNPEITANFCETNSTKSGKKAGHPTSQNYPTENHLHLLVLSASNPVLVEHLVDS